ncbi:MAG TPA: cytochrome C oxidase subunit IV family protein [Candidatus Kapabacteria bacterium]|nr:cytochrome C oxidase subunit IV family protein [Candidatus Kapabacteria bacterium]
MEAHSVADIKKTVRTYVTVFISLMGLTIITVAVSYLHLEIKEAIAVAMCIAIVKGSLVASYFMHLISERKAIYFSLLLTVTFFLVMMFIPMLSFSDQQGIPLH